MCVSLSVITQKWLAVFKQEPHCHFFTVCARASVGKLSPIHLVTFVLLAKFLVINVPIQTGDKIMRKALLASKMLHIFYGSYVNMVFTDRHQGRLRKQLIYLKKKI